MRTSIFISSIIAFLCLISLSEATFAQESTSTPSTTPTVSEAAAPAPTPREERRTALGAAAQARLTNLAANVSNRMDAYVRRISNVTDRLESRAGKMEAAGMDTQAARNKIAEARTELERAHTTLTTIDAAVAGFVGSENPRAQWQQVKATYTTARDTIKAAHRATIEALLLLKTAGTPAPTATTSEATTNTVE